jgi:outer membrane murein-binding lipoprotein Lpp
MLMNTAKRILAVVLSVGLLAAWGCAEQQKMQTLEDQNTQLKTENLRLAEDLKAARTSVQGLIEARAKDKEEGLQAAEKAAGLAEQAAAAKADATNAKAEIEKLRQTIAKANQERSELEERSTAKLDAMNKQVAEAAARSAELQKQVATLEQKIAETEKALNDLEAQLKEKKE